MKDVLPSDKEIEKVSPQTEIDKSEFASVSTCCSDSSHVLNAGTIGLTEHLPVPLKNSGENAGFFNSFAQVFYSLRRCVNIY